MKSQHIIFKLALATIGIGFAILFYLYYLDGTWIRPILSTGTAPRKYITLQDHYNVGDDVVVNLSDFCKLRDVPTTLYWTLVDDVVLYYPPKESHFLIGCFKGKTAEVETLPDYIGNHSYHFEGTIAYHMIARDINVKVYTNSFFVNPGTNRK